MIIDSQLQLSLAQAITAQAVSTNTIYLSAVRDIAVGEEFSFFTTVTTAMTDSGSDSTVAVELIQSTAADLSSPDVLQTLYTFSALSAIGTLKYAKVQPGLITKRYIGVRYTPAGGNLTTGSFTTAIVKDAQLYRSYAAGFSIS